jgi:hypothetical protein
MDRQPFTPHFLCRPIVIKPFSFFYKFRRSVHGKVTKKYTLFVVKLMRTHKKQEIETITIVPAKYLKCTTENAGLEVH